MRTRITDTSKELSDYLKEKLDSNGTREIKFGGFDMLGNNIESDKIICIYDNELGELKRTDLETTTLKCFNNIDIITKGETC